MVHIGFGGQLLTDNNFYKQYSNDDVRIESNKIVSLQIYLHTYIHYTY